MIKCKPSAWQGVLIVIGLLAFAAPASAQSKTKLIVACFAPTTIPQIRETLGAFADEMTQRTNGAVEVELHGAGSPYATSNQIIPEVERGVVDMGWGVLNAYPGRFPLTQLTEMPFMVVDPIEASRRLMKFFPGHLDGEFKTVKVLQISFAATNAIHLRQPATKLADLKGMRVIGDSEVTRKFIENYGGQSAALPVPAAYENMQKGTVDGIIVTWGALIGFHLAEVAHHHIGAPISAAPAYFFMNRDSYDRLPTAAKAVVDEWSTPDAAAKTAGVIEKYNRIALETVQKRGDTITMLDAQAIADANAKMASYDQSAIAALEGRGLPAKRIYDEMKKALHAGD